MTFINPMIESQLSFLEMQLKGALGQAVELGHPSFFITPAALNAVDVSFARGELISIVVNSEMIVETDIKQAIVTGPAVRMNARSRIDFPPDDPMQGGLGGVRHDFRIDHHAITDA